MSENKYKILAEQECVPGWKRKPRRQRQQERHQTKGFNEQNSGCPRALETFVDFSASSAKQQGP